ncbi:MAG: transcriptional regulator [Clostridiales bacterium GWB2_37_7]|nr:MAG: transcriptional regulator [Clostridiales bacterium GWB2_37_7]
MFSGDRLKHLRLEKNLTQIELGKIFNTSHATINRYEKGVNEPDSETINKFADFFNVSTDYLLGRTNTKNNKERISHAINDDVELLEFWNTLKERPDLQLMFKQTKDLKENDIKQIIKIIKAFEDEEASIED